MKLTNKHLLLGLCAVFVLVLAGTLLFRQREGWVLYDGEVENLQQVLAEKYTLPRSDSAVIRMMRHTESDVIILWEDAQTQLLHMDWFALRQSRSGRSHAVWMGAKGAWAEGGTVYKITGNFRGSSDSDHESLYIICGENRTLQAASYVLRSRPDSSNITAGEITFSGPVEREYFLEVIYLHDVLPLAETTLEFLDADGRSLGPAY